MSSSQEICRACIYYLLLTINKILIKGPFCTRILLSTSKKKISIYWNFDLYLILWSANPIIFNLYLELGSGDPATKYIFKHKIGFFQIPKQNFDKINPLFRLFSHFFGPLTFKRLSLWKAGQKVVLHFTHIPQTGKRFFMLS